MSHRTLALVSREIDAPIARVSGPMPMFGIGLQKRPQERSQKGVQEGTNEHTISVAQFLHHVRCLAERLPQARHVLNICDNRYTFLVAFCAAIVRSQTNLLPPNKNVATQGALLARYEDSYIIHDGAVECDDAFPQLDISALALCSRVDSEVGSEFDSQIESDQEIPHIAEDFLAAISFTSGSTGKSSPNLKYWKTLVESSEINLRYMLPAANKHDKGGVIWQLATVPAQHMWGLETSALLPLFAAVCVSDARPLFAQDIYRCLASLPAPRMLVSTPVHLRALVASGLDFPEVERVLCATAPLSQVLAQDVEALFRGSLHEVYGCSEVGSMSCRETAKTDIWNIFSGLEFRAPASEGESVVVHAPHLPAPVALQDRLERLNASQFRLLGRSDDMIEIAGKRGSIQEVNKVLLGIDSVLDGVVFLPEPARAEESCAKTSRTHMPAVQRLVAIVVLKEGLETGDREIKNTIRAHFRECLDAAFAPRPIYIVDALPREENGKLPKAKLLAMFRQLQEQA